MFPPIEYRLPGELGPVATRVVNRTAVSGSYTVLITDYLIGVTSTSAAYTITLPTVPSLNQMFIIKDESGAAATNNISITVDGTVTIDGSTTQKLNTNYGAVIVYYSGSAYFFM